MRTTAPSNRCTANAPLAIQRRTVRVETPRASATCPIVQKLGRACGARRALRGRGATRVAFGSTSTNMATKAMLNFLIARKRDHARRCWAGSYQRYGIFRGKAFALGLVACAPAPGRQVRRPEDRGARHIANVCMRSVKLHRPLLAQFNQSVYDGNCRNFERESDVNLRSLAFSRASCPILLGTKSNSTQSRCKECAHPPAPPCSNPFPHAGARRR
jgi:hypothetical protein